MQYKTEPLTLQVERAYKADIPFKTLPINLILVRCLRCRPDAGGRPGKLRGLPCNLHHNDWLKLPLYCSKLVVRPEPPEPWLAMDSDHPCSECSLMKGSTLQRSPSTWRNDSWRAKRRKGSNGSKLSKGVEMKTSCGPAQRTRQRNLHCGARSSASGAVAERERARECLPCTLRVRGA
jgi:hypothetical protein